MHDLHLIRPMNEHYGVAVNTIKAWLSVLEATYQVIVLRPYFANVGKRLVKTRKVYFTDVGPLCHLAGLRDPAHAASGPLGGATMETAVLSEIVKITAHRGLTPRVFFWRTLAGWGNAMAESSASAKASASFVAARTGRPPRNTFRSEAAVGLPAAHFATTTSETKSSHSPRRISHQSRVTC